MANYVAAIRRAAKRNGVDPDILVAQLRAESGLNPNAVSPAGARGIAQFMPGTAPSYGVDLYDGNWRDDVKGAAKFMKANLRSFGGDYRKALAAYNAGPGAVQQYGGVPPYAETQNYVQKIMSAAGGADRTEASPRPNRNGNRRSDGGSDPVAVTVPGEDNSDQRRMLALQYFATKDRDPNALLNYAAQLGNAQDGPSTTELIGGGGGRPNRSNGGGGGGGGANPFAGRRRAPAVSGNIIGTPHSGTHTLGNWQSDNAVDVSYPVGGKVRSPRNGVVEKVGGSYGDGSSRFDGYQVTIRTQGGNRIFMTHLSKTNLRPGQRVRAGQVIGKGGAANGVPHLHLGAERGNPAKFVEDED